MKNNKGFTPIVIVFIILAVLAIGGVAYYAGIKNSPVSQNKTGDNFQSQTNQNNTSITMLSPKEGDQWIVGQKYSISLNEGLISDYHPLLQTFDVLNLQGNRLGAICPGVVMKKGDKTFNWKAGDLITACSGTSNVSVNVPQGKYQILFTEVNSNGDTVSTEKSGWFKIVPTSSVSITLPTPYISAQEGWPPVVKNSEDTYSCTPTPAAPGMQKTVEKVVSNRIYCITTQNDGAAGSTYSTYTYKVSSDNGIETTNFTLRYTNCGVYDEPQHTQCQNAQSNFNLDAIVDSIM